MTSRRKLFRPHSTNCLIRGLDQPDGYQHVSVFQKHRDDLFELFNMVKTGGVKSLLSVRGGTLINNLRKG